MFSTSDIFREEPVIQLTQDEWDRFTTSLEQPGQEPGEATIKAVELFKQGCDEGDIRVW